MNARRQARVACSVVLIAAMFTLAGVAHAQQQPNERLVLKDGTYQSVVKYEVQGDRVHYLSAERYEYEDIPTSLIDWDATKKYNEELSANKLKTHVIETTEEKEAREKEEANSPEIAPGVKLPGSGGVFLLDEFQGKPELAEIVQNGGEADKKPKKSGLNPFATKQGYEIKGAHAQIQSHVPRPTIYIDIDAGSIEGSTPTDRFRLIRATVKNGARVIGNLKITITGDISEKASFLPAQVEKLGTGQWLKLTPTQNLPPGEYAVMEMLGPHEINVYVWDFGVNPKAPANPNTWRPVEAK